MKQYTFLGSLRYYYDITVIDLKIYLFIDTNNYFRF